MKLHVLFGQRKEQYAGEYAPEAIVIADEYAYEENPEFIEDTKAENEASGEFEALAVVTFEVSQEAIVKRLRPETAPLKATVVDD